MLTLRKLLKSFSSDESGAVTVDWVVLTAAIVGLGLVVMNTVGPAVQDVATNITTDLTQASDAAK
jgi:Flp pilus assembly pilin Flp